MQKLKYIIIYLMGQVLFAACSDKDSAVLSNAEALTDVYPDSALTILQNLDPGDFSERNRAVYNIILTRAIDKANPEYQTNDSLALAALDYFKDKDEPHYLMLSYFYAGQIAFTNNDYPTAVYYLEESADLADKLQDHLNLALTYRTLTDLYQETWLGLESVRYAKLAREEFRKAGDKGTKYIHWADSDLADAYYAAGMYDSCIVLENQVIDYARKNNERFMERHSSGTKALAFSKQHLPDSAIILIERMLELYPAEDLDNNELNLLAIVYSHLYDSEKSRYYQSIMTSRGGEFLFDYTNLCHEGKYKDAFDGLFKSLKVFNEMFSGAQKSAIGISQRKYMENKLQKEEYANKVSRYKLATIAVTVIMLLLITVIYIHYKLKQSRFDQELKEQEISRIFQEVRQKDRLIADLRDDNKQLQSENVNLSNTLIRDAASQIHSIRNTIFGDLDDIETLFSDLNQSYNDDRAKKMIFNKIIKFFDKRKLDAKSIKKVESEINRYLDNLMVKFHNDFPKIKDNYTYIFIYSILGFSSQAIALFIDSEVTQIYNIKKRLRVEILETETPYAEDYLKFL